MRIDLEVLNSMDHIITTSTSDSEKRENQRISMRIVRRVRRVRIKERVREIFVLGSFDLIITTSTSDKAYV